MIARNICAMPFSPRRVSDLCAWYSATAPEGSVNWPSDNSPLGVLNDLSGNGNLATGHGSPNPLFKTNIQNGFPGILFDGANAYFQIADNAIMDCGNGFTMFIVAKPIIDGNYVLMNKRAAGGSLGWQSSIIMPVGTDYGMQYSSSFGDIYSDTSWLNGNCHLYVWNVGLTETRMYQDGVLVKTQAGDYRPADASSADSYIGSDRGGSNFFNGYIHEIYLYRRSLDNTTMNGLMQQLNQKWQIY